MSFLEDFWDFFWWFFFVYAFIAFLWALFAVFGDLFRDDKLSGWWKAVWIFFLVFVPVLGVLVYLIARGKGMTERSMERSRANREASNAYIRSVAAPSPSEEISKATALRDSGTISADEFERIKSKALV
ncbi:PLDc N-terminal domain-containing protein [Arthrobacter sp. NPDC056886]|uniref:PLDc N-terminal domain-containing protein n=1 Tax=Arthrobacter sp. NPDC056886 TaxID=3345960 RepID=UPI00366F7EB3